MKKRAEVVFTALIFISLSIASCSTPVSRSLFNEDKGVFSAIFAQLCSRSVQNGYYFITSETEIVDPSFVPSGMEGSMRQSLIGRNRLRTTLPTMIACEGYRGMDAKELESYLGDSNKEGLPERWVAFYEKNEGMQGVISLSLPGYSAQGDLAVVQVSSSCGWLCGGGSFWVVRKVSGKWQVDADKRISGWQS